MEQTGFVEVEGARLYYETAGSGPAFVLLHAGIADCTMWDIQFKALQEAYQVIRYDARGYGRSETMASVKFSNRDDLRAVLDHLGVDKAILMGCSRGGQIAMDFTIDSPDRVRALITVCAGLGGYDFGSIIPPEEMALFEEAEAAEEAKDWELVADYDVRIWVDGITRRGQAPESVREKVREMCLQLYAREDDPGEVIPLDPPAAQRLGEIHVPVLAIVGQYDTAVARAAAEVIGTQIAGAYKVIIQETAHVPNMEQPLKFYSVLLAFLKKLPA